MDIMAATSVKILNSLLCDLFHIAIPLRLSALSRMLIRPNRLEFKTGSLFFQKRVSIIWISRIFSHISDYIRQNLEKIPHFSISIS